MVRLTKMATPNLQRVGFSSLTYNAAACRYVDTKTKRFLSPERVRAIVDNDIAARAERMQRLAQRVASGEINSAEFGAQMRREVKAVHLTQGAAGAGGFHNLTPRTWGKIGGLLPYHYRRVNAFVADLNNGRYGEPPDVKQVEDRCSLFSEAARGTYEAVRLAQETAAGFGWEENELDDGAVHCLPTAKVESCPQQTAKGRVPTGTLLLPTQRACGPRCRCKIRRYKIAV